MKLLFACLLLFIADGSAYSRLKTEPTATVTLQLKQCANDTIRWKDESYLMKWHQVILNAQGQGVITIPQNKQKRFISVYVRRFKQDFTVWVDSTTRVVFNKDTPQRYFSGIGSEINNYLYEIDAIYNPLYDSVFNVHEVKEINAIASEVEEKYDSLYHHFFHKNPLTKEMQYILKTHAQAAVLCLKQSFLYQFHPPEMDSLGLEKKVGLDAHDFFSDSLLVNFNSLYFDAYLVQSLDFYAYKSFVFNEDAHVNTINAVNSIDGAKMYSRPIRNLLLYNFLYGHIKSEGATFYSDSITNALFAQKKLSLERYKNVNDLKQLHAHLLPGKPAPHLQGITTEGKVVTLKDFIGKVVFVDIWATWCGPCIKALPRVMELQEKLKNNKEVVFIFLSKDCHEEEPWINYLKAHPNFKGIHLRERAKEDFPYELNWEIIGIPHYLLIDKQGNIIDAFAHNNSYEKLAEMIEEASRK